MKTSKWKKLALGSSEQDSREFRWLAQAGDGQSCPEAPWDELKANTGVPRLARSAGCSELPLPALDIFLLISCIFNIFICGCTGTPHVYAGPWKLEEPETQA